MYTVGTAVNVRAYHVMPLVEGPESERHAHDYRIEVVVERAVLDRLGMVADLDLLEQALGELAGRLRDADLADHVTPAPEEGVTVEVFAHWVHETLAPSVRQAGGELLTVRVWETSDAFGGYSGPV